MLTVTPVDAENWRAVAALRVHPEQAGWVAEPAYYLALCHYSPQGWSPLAGVDEDGRVVGFLMWAVDTADGAAWLGGIIIDAEQQGRGFGRALVTATLDHLKSLGHNMFALSYEPDNERAKGLYTSLGFVESGEVEGDEVVARLNLV